MKNFILQILKLQTILFPFFGSLANDNAIVVVAGSHFHFAENSKVDEIMQIFELTLHLWGDESRCVEKG